MAGGGLCHILATVHLCEGMKGGSMLIFAWVVLLVSMETPTVVAVGSKCSFEGRYLPSIQALELTCQCPKDTTDFNKLTAHDPVKIKFRNGSGKWLRLYDSLLKKAQLPDVKVVTDEQGGPGLRSKQTLRRMNYTAQPREADYTCVVEGRLSTDLIDRKVLSLSKIEGFPTPPTTVSTTTAATTTTSTTATTAARLPPITPPREDSTLVAATLGKTEGGFTSVGLYVTVALSCVLLIVIVSAIICFVRVRARRRREKEEMEEDLDLENFQPHAANNNLIYKRAEACRGCRQPCHCTDQLGKSNGDCPVGHFPAGKMIGPGCACAVHTPLQAPQTCADVHRQGNGEQGERGAPQADTAPLLDAYRQDQGQQQRGSVTSADEEDLTRRKERLRIDTPRRLRSRDPVPGRRRPGHSRSFDVLDREETPHGRGVRPHRFSFPRNSYDETSDEDMTDPGHHHRRHPAYYYPPRSWSQHSLQRHRGREDYSPIWTSTAPRPYHAVPQHDYDEDQFRTARVPRGYSYVYGDSQPQHPARRVRSRQAVSGDEASTFTVRAQEGHPMRYPDPHPPPATRQDDHWPPESAGSHGGETSGAETTEPDYPPEPAGRNLRAEREAAVFQQQPRYPQDGRQPPGSTPSSRQPRYASSPSRSRHYSTTSSPRRPSDERRSRSPRHPRHNLSHPHLFYLSDSGADTEPRLHPEVVSEDLLRPAHFSTWRSQGRPQHGKSRRRSRSVGNITDGGVDSVPRHQPPRGGGRRGISPERPAPQVAFQEVPPSSAEGGQHQRPMNVLSRDRLSPSQAVPPPLNVPFTHTQSAQGASAATGQQQLGDSTPRQTPGVDVPARAPTANTGEDASRPSGSNSRGVARPSDPSPNTSPPQEGRSLSSSSISDSNNDSPKPSASRGHRRERATVAEIEVRDIKTDHETRRKRPLSFKVTNHNGRPPVACVADMAQSIRGAAPPAVTATARGRRQEERREGGPRPGSSEPWHEQFGVQVMPSLENAGNAQLSRFAEHYHNTSAKTPHPRPE